MAFAIMYAINATVYYNVLVVVREPRELGSLVVVYSLLTTGDYVHTSLSSK